ncbi:TM2 domain-containing protein [Paenibacillus aquistagni]|uniref:TM2 domain-containing membrane protein YozV n=1 Tax=Paenibacillus aquistagni TaxID=1852522 RepID=A0A1X7IX71_9BACL|nr:TM2 domain-containing protein [Paenibacillus aquistagni]SMG19086.1 TM2 domain-containing membrane protein YozV [Paenibacillus aquistagni]
MSIVAMKSQLDARELMIVDSEVKSQGKNMGIAYVLWFFLGGFGGHRFYMGKTGSGVAQLLLMLASTLLTILLIGVVGFIALGLWVLIDAFFVHKWVTDYNVNVEMKTIQGLLNQRRA